MLECSVDTNPGENENGYLRMTISNITATDITSALRIEAIEPQRWFRHKGQVHGGPTLVDGWPVRHLGELIGWWLIVRIPVEGGEALYQVPVSLGKAPPSEHAIVFGSLDWNGTTLHILDATENRAILADLIARMRHDGAAPLERGQAIAQAFGAPPPFPKEIDPLNLNSSNTLSCLDRSLLLKVYRCLDNAGTREVRLLRGLADSGTDAVPALVASLEYRKGGNSLGALALIQEWIHDAEDTWNWLAGQIGGGPVNVVEDIAGMAGAVADIHRGLMGLHESNPASAWTGQHTDALKTKVHDRLDALERQHGDWAPELRDLVARARSVADSIVVAEGTPRCQVHGDLHLGQLLRHEWHFGFMKFRVIDFEGEPLATSEDRVAEHSPLKDIAGMLRSFDYAVTYARQHGAPGSDKEWADWYTGVESEFLHTYSAEISPAFPAFRDATENGLLVLYLIEKAAYEISYERSARPDWAHIPLGGFKRLLDRLPA